MKMKIDNFKNTVTEILNDYIIQTKNSKNLELYESALSFNDLLIELITFIHTTRTGYCTKTNEDTNEQR